MARLACVGDIVLDRYGDGGVFLGGVGLNVAVQAARCGLRTTLYAAVGDDFGSAVIEHLRVHSGVDLALTVVGGRTASICVGCEWGERKFGPISVGIMPRLQDHLKASELEQFDIVFVPLLNGLSEIATVVSGLVDRSSLVFQLSEHSVPAVCWGIEIRDLEHLAGLYKLSAPDRAAAEVSIPIHPAID